jgi:hypothetical protein
VGLGVAALALTVGRLAESSRKTITAVRIALTNMDVCFMENLLKYSLSFVGEG